ncbi:MAG: hypothetical protein Q4B99_05015 [Clostridia bacterium]|nr:hypothetical protein [Clostridia bacterium]
MPTLIETIRSAEERAAAIRREAAADARDVVADARLNYDAAINRANEDGKALLVSAREQSEYEGGEEARRIVARYEREAQELCADARGNTDAAVAYILERLSDI